MIAERYFKGYRRFCLDGDLREDAATGECGRVVDAREMRQPDGERAAFDQALRQQVGAVRVGEVAGRRGDARLHGRSVGSTEQPGEVVVRLYNGEVRSLQGGLYLRRHTPDIGAVDDPLISDFQNVSDRFGRVVRDRKGADADAAEASFAPRRQFTGKEVLLGALRGRMQRRRVGDDRRAGTTGHRPGRRGVIDMLMRQQDRFQSRRSYSETGKVGCQHPL